MEIIIDNAKVTLSEYTAHTLNVSYTYPETKDSVTFYFRGMGSKTAIISETTVNGVQMTAYNIDELLSPLFNSNNTEGGITENDKDCIINSSTKNQGTINIIADSFKINDKSIDDLVDLTTDQSIGGNKTFNSGIAIAPNATLSGSEMGLDAPFGTSALRFFNNNNGGSIQFVSTYGSISNWAGGNNIMNITTAGINMLNHTIANVSDPTNDKDVANKGYVDNSNKNLQIEYIDPLVLPEATKIGQIVEIYKDSKLDSTYLWNGWIWQLIGAEPNFAYVPDTFYVNTIENFADFYYKENGVSYMLLNENLDYFNNEIIALKIIKPNKNIRFSSVMFNLSANKNLDIELNEINSRVISTRTDDTNSIKESVTVTNCMADYLTLQCYAKNINFSNNDISEASIGLFNMDIATASDIVIKNNRGLKNLTLSGFSNGSIVSSIDLELNNSIEIVNISYSTFSQEALDTLVDVMLSIETGSRTLYQSSISPALTDTQKTTLTNAGWTIA